MIGLSDTNLNGFSRSFVNSSQIVLTKAVEK
jgi:hypothetical protein